MEVFECAAAVRLKSIHGRFLWADGNRKSVSQMGDARDEATVWKVEQVTGGDAVRLKSVHDLYLAETDFAYILGLTGKKVIQSYSSKADSAVEWQPLSQGKYVRLKTRRGTFLRANGVMIPGYRNSVTHDIPESPATQSWILWEVQIVESIRRQPPVEEAPIHICIPSSQQDCYWKQTSTDERQTTQRVSMRHSDDEEEEERPRTPPQRGFGSQYDAYEARPRTPPRTPPQSEFGTHDYNAYEASPRTSVSHFDPEEERPRRSSPRTSMNRFDLEEVSPRTPRRKHQNSLGDTREVQGYYGRVTPSSPRKRQSGSPREPSLSRRSSSSSSLNPDSHRIFYTMTNEDGDSSENTEWGSFVFDSSSVKELKEELQKRTGINEDILVCIRSPLSSKLSVYREELLPENVTVMLEVVKVNSPVGKMLAKPHSVRTVYSRGNSTDFRDSVG